MLLISYRSLPCCQESGYTPKPPSEREQHECTADKKTNPHILRAMLFNLHTFLCLVDTFIYIHISHRETEASNYVYLPS